MKHLFLFIALLCSALGQGIINPGGGVSQTALDAKAAITGSNITDPETFRGNTDSAEAQEMHERLWTWRKKFSIDQVGDIGAFGDSMLGGTEVQAEMRPLVAKTFGSAGYCYLEPYESGGATKYSGATGIFTNWFTGTVVRLAGSGHTATVNVDNSSPVEANTLKLFYVKKSGGGVFGVQTRKNSGTWTDESTTTRAAGVTTNASPNISFTSTGVIPPVGSTITGTSIPGGTTILSATTTTAVMSANATGGTGITFTFTTALGTIDTNAATDGGIISITKTDFRALWDIRAVYVSGGDVDIIGGALYDTRLKGARYGMFAVGSTNLSQNVSANSTVTATIMASVGLDLAILSHLDGAAEVPTNQATFQDNINTASGTAPNWLVIGPPVGQTDVEDALRKAQTSAMKSLASTRRDAFWDNRRWAGTPAQAVAAGLHSGTSDPHYENLAAANWVPAMFHELGLGESRVTNAGTAGDIRLLGAPMIRRDEIVNSGDSYLAVPGDLSVGPVPGLSPSGVGRVRFWDTSGPSSSADWGGISYTNDALTFSTSGTARFTIDSGIGKGPIFAHQASTAATPLSVLGASYAPILEINVGKTIVAAGTTTAQTINKTSGRINFAAADASKVVTSNE